MTLWIILTLLSLVAAILIAVPFLKRGGNARGSDVSVALAREQLKELKADLGRGLISEDEAALARSEIERRILAAAKQGDFEVTQTSDRARVAGIGLAVGWVVVGSAVLYTFIGRPDLPSGQLANLPPTSSQVAAGPSTSIQDTQVGSVDSMIAGLEAKLAENPDDVEGWRMLGWSYFNTGNYIKSAEAYGKAVDLDGSDPVILSVYGEAMVRAGGGEVTDAALDVFHRALALDPVDPRARFFQGMALEQRGNPEGAIRLWAEILETAPQDADWAPGLRGRIGELADQIGFDLATLATWNEVPESKMAAPLRGPTQADVAAAQSMDEDDRQAMIQGMVERLANRLSEDPNDPEGWKRLIRSYVVLNDPEAASAALGRARDALGVDTSSYAAVSDSAAELGVR